MEFEDFSFKRTDLLGSGVLPEQLSSICFCSSAPNTLIHPCALRVYNTCTFSILMLYSASPFLRYTPHHTASKPPHSVTPFASPPPYPGANARVYHGSYSGFKVTRSGIESLYDENVTMLMPDRLIGCMRTHIHTPGGHNPLEGGHQGVGSDVARVRSRFLARGDADVHRI